MTIQEKVKSMHVRMAEMRDSARSPIKHRCFGLLHDAVVHTGPRIDDLKNSSLVGYIELAAMTVNDPAPCLNDLKHRLTNLGFNTSVVN